MPGITPTAITPPPSIPTQEPSKLGLGKDQTKPLDKDLEKHLGHVQGKHKPEAKNKPQPQHKPEAKSKSAHQQQQPASSNPSNDDSTKHSHHKHHHKHAHQPAAAH